MNCICGCANYENLKCDGFEVNSLGELVSVELNLVRCTNCGIIRQLSFKNDREYLDYYQKKYPPNVNDYYIKNYKHDRELARKRFDDYELRHGMKLLDIGSGSGAFVDEARSHGLQAFGCELANYHYAKSNEHIYCGQFEKLNFPTDYFDVVTCHDVLEHSLNPLKFLSESFRVIKQDGLCLVDFPDYFDDNAKHHWKKTEHIWFFTRQQLDDLLTSIGFKIIEVSKPIQSKLLYKLTKPLQERTRILFPPGIGDSYWSAVKLRSFLDHEKLGLPDIFVVCPRVKSHGGHNRSFPFLQMFPFLHSTWESIEGKESHLQKIWKEAYAGPGRTRFQNVAGFDYFISYNGNLRVGKSLEEVDPDLRCEWFPPMFISLKQERFRRHAINNWGKYIVFYFVFGGTYQYWSKEFPVSDVLNAISRIVKLTEFIPVFVGAIWDGRDKSLQYLVSSVPNAINLVGKTSVEQLFGLLRGAQAVVGYPSGLTIISTVLGKKTFILWNDYYNRDFAKNACPPSTWECNYFAENTLGLKSRYFANWVVDRIIGKDHAISRIIPDRQEAFADLAVGADSTELFRPKVTVKSSVVSRNGVAVLCVLKSGGNFDGVGEKYIENLFSMLRRHTSRAFNFYCLTDSDIKISGVKVVKLTSDLPGWWSKVELFKPASFKEKWLVYFDLDTLILDNIDDLLKPRVGFYGLRPWNKRNRRLGLLASGIMAWNNDYNFIYDDFSESDMSVYRNDQLFISNVLMKHDIRYQVLQNEIYGIRSYKRECLPKLPPRTRIVCFHGSPRPHEVGGWVSRNWR